MASLLHAADREELAMTQSQVVTEPVAHPGVLSMATEEHTRIRWGAVFGGAVAALGIWALLHAFGLAVGLSTVDPADGNLRGAGIFTGIWSIIASLIALFIGGLVASRGADALTKGSGAMHGLVMWGLTTLIGAWAFANVVSSLMGGAVSLGRTAGAMDIDMNDALAPINERLQREGKPQIQAAQV